MYNSVLTVTWEFKERNPTGTMPPICLHGAATRDALHKCSPAEGTLAFVKSAKCLIFSILYASQGIRKSFSIGFNEFQTHALMHRFFCRKGINFPFFFLLNVPI